MVTKVCVCLCVLHPHDENTFYRTFAVNCLLIPRMFWAALLKYQFYIHFLFVWTKHCYAILHTFTIFFDPRIVKLELVNQNLTFGPSYEIYILYEYENKISDFHFIYLLLMRLRDMDRCQNFNCNKFNVPTTYYGIIIKTMVAFMRAYVKWSKG